MIFNTPRLIMSAAAAGLGLAFIPMDQAQTSLDDGRLVQVLGDWCPSYPGYHLYYPSRRELSVAFRLLVDALRFRS